MPKSPISPLVYGELIRPAGCVKILGPGEIPIHPRVYDSEFAFTREYLARIRESLVESMRKDLSVIERVINLGSTRYEITEHGIVHGVDLEISFADIIYYADPRKRAIGTDYGSSNIDIMQHLERELNVDESPIPRPKLEEYAFDYETDGHPRIHVWYTHNYLDHGFPLELYFRSFAIMFNNLGIREL